MSGQDICKKISRLFLWDKITHNKHKNVITSVYKINLPYKRYCSPCTTDYMIVARIEQPNLQEIIDENLQELIQFRSTEMDEDGYNTFCVNFEEFLILDIWQYPNDSFVFTNNTGTYFSTEEWYTEALADYQDFLYGIADTDYEESESEETENSNINNLNGIMDIIDANKQNISNGDYIELCKQLKNIYDSNDND
jgi:hypothetical protein